MSHFDIEAELLMLGFQQMYVAWGKQAPPRAGLHASALLAKDAEWCLREHVLHELYPEQGESREWNAWDWRTSAIFENGWDLHRRWQRVFLKHGNVVYSPVSPAFVQNNLQHPMDFLEGRWCAAELDLTHYDETRHLYFSPDAIIEFGGVRYVVEIKGIKHEAYEMLTDDLEQACAANETVAKAREQVNLYLHLLMLERGIILVENKSTQDFRLWVVEYERERAWKYTNRLYEIQGRVMLVKAHGASKLPLRCCQTSNDARARQCPMRACCFAEKGENNDAHVSTSVESRG
jgi:hypothetical protein